jgi:hypothetical protein
MTQALICGKTQKDGGAPEDAIKLQNSELARYAEKALYKRMAGT